MSTTSPTRESWLLCGSRIAAWTFFFFVALLNLLLPIFITPKFKQIFAEALPGMPLPPLTEFILNYPALVLCFDCLWPLAGIYAIFVPKKTSTSTMIVIGSLILIFLQIGATIIALFMPMIITITVMPNPR